MEYYKIRLEGDSITFDEAEFEMPFSVPSSPAAVFTPAKGIQLIARMGDPDLSHCLVLKNDSAPGGYFLFADKNDFIFVCAAETNLLFAIAQGYFGELTANARYGVDVFENLEEPDD